MRPVVRNSFWIAAQSAAAMSIENVCSVCPRKSGHAGAVPVPTVAPPPPEPATPLAPDPPAPPFPGCRASIGVDALPQALPATNTNQIAA
jgi:hypothetical protein